MSKVIQELKDRKCKIIVKKGLFKKEIKCKILDCDDEWIKITYYDKNIIEIVKVFKLKYVLSISYICN